MKPHKLLPIEIMDWYDGIVIATARTSWLPGVFLVSLLSWNQTKRQRVYILIPISETDVANIRSSSEWEALTSRLRMLGAGARGDAILILWDETTEEAIAESSTSIAAVRDELMSHVDDALKPERQRWFDVVRKG